MTPPAIFTAAGFRAGARAMLPIIIGLAPFGMVAGVTAQAHHLSLLEALLMSGLVFAGSAQILALSAWTVPAAALTAALTALAMNLRFALMGPLLAPWLDAVRGWRRWGSLALLVDQNWAVAIQRIKAGANDAAFFLGSGVTLWVVWVLSTALGHVLGQLVSPAPGHPVFFAALAAFVTLLIPLWRGRRDLLPWMSAAAVALIVAHHWPHGSWHVIAGALAGALTGAVRDRSTGAE